MVTLFSFACQSEKEIESDYQAIYAIFEENGFEVESINSKSKNGISVYNMNELETVLKFLKGKEVNQKLIDQIIGNNEIDQLPQLNFNDFFVYKIESPNFSEQNRVLCIHNWRNVNARIGIGGGFGSTFVDIGFSIGTGTGLIENFDASLEGFTFMLSMGKNHFRNDGFANPSNGYSYVGTYDFSVKVVLFFEGLGEIITFERKSVRIRVDGCTGGTTYSFIEE